METQWSATEKSQKLVKQSLRELLDTIEASLRKQESTTVKLSVTLILEKREYKVSGVNHI